MLGESINRRPTFDGKKKSKIRHIWESAIYADPKMMNKKLLGIVWLSRMFDKKKLNQIIRLLSFPKLIFT
jgi:hypothetical protein